MTGQPPGQLQLWRPDPGATARWWLVVATGYRSDRIRTLPLAASMAGVAADTYGEAWLVADDTSTAHVDHAGDVQPTTGWAAPVARIITRSTTTP